VIPRHFRDARCGDFVGVQLDRRPAVVLDVVQRFEDALEVDDALSGCEVLMDAVASNIFEVYVRDLLGHRADNRGGIVAHAKEMTDVAVHPHLRVVLEEFVFERQVLGRGFDEESRLRLNRENHVVPLRELEHAG
jgi:hypothetical protein